MTEQPTSELLEKILDELKSITHELRGAKVDTCSRDEALLILGLKNKRYLKYFVDQGLLTRRKGEKWFLYFKTECIELALRIKNKSVIVPTQREMYNYN